MDHDGCYQRSVFFFFYNLDESKDDVKKFTIQE